MKPTAALSWPKAILGVKPIGILPNLTRGDVLIETETRSALQSTETQMETPKEMERLQKLVDDAVDQHPDSIEDATEAVLKKANRVQWFEKLKDELIRRAIAKLIHDTRHQINVAMRNASGDYGGPAKVTAGAASGRIAMGVMSYMIAGKTLGMLTGDELPEIAESEAARAEGHEFNVRLCRALAKIVKGEKTVKECVSATKLRAIFQKT